MTQMMAQESWHSLVDVERLRMWMDAKGLEQGPILDAQTLAGGTQNLLLRFRRGGRQFVLRRPPKQPRGDGNATIEREVRVLTALATTEVPHPRLAGACLDRDVLGAAFYLMESIEGFNATVELPRRLREDRQARRRMGFALVDGALALGRVDHMAVGLGDFGKLSGFLERQVPRWRRQLDSYAQFPDWPGADTIPGVLEVANWLEANRPAKFTPGIIHGDYHLANVMFRPNEPELAAIIDWELATIGDPLLDLGWIIATWPGPNGETTSEIRVEPWDGFPVIDELIEHYARNTHRDLSNISWYGVLGCYKLGIILEGTHARACAGAAPKSTGDRLHATCVKLFRRAIKIMERS